MGLLSEAIDVERPPAHEMNREFFLRGELEHILRPHRQTEFFRFLREWTVENPYRYGPLVANCHRRLGKSFALIAYGVHRCLKDPDTIALFGTPTLVQGRDYLLDIWGRLERFSPTHDLWCERSGDNFTFRNPDWPLGSKPSVFKLRGVRSSVGNPGDALRGARANVAILDEVREMPEDWIRYIVNDVLSYQFVGQKNPVLILSSTPPKSGAHQYTKFFIPEARREGRYFLAPAETTDEAEGNKDFTEEDKRLILEDCPGGEESVSYQREALCKLISDPDWLVVPEFPPLKDRVVRRVSPPPFFDAYVGIDFGWQDHNGVVFAHLDFLEQKLCFTGEVFLSNVSTGELVGAAKEHERKLWLAKKTDPARHVASDGTRWRYREVFRCGDHSMQQLADMWLDHDFFVLEADKWDRDAAIANYRHGIQSGKVVIDPSCTELISQHEHGTWKTTVDGKKRDFSRTKVHGHLDLLAAAIYLYRKVSWLENPYPNLEAPSATDFFVDPEENSPDTPVQPPQATPHSDGPRRGRGTRRELRRSRLSRRSR